MLDAKTEKAVAFISEDARRAFGADLVSLVLYGSAAGDDFAPGRSDLNFAIVLERIAFVHLKALQSHLPAWRKRGASTPLLFDRAFLDRACDVFPGEFLDIQAQHRVLYGEEVFATLRIDARHLRYQSEYEVRGKLLRLRALYAEVGADRARLTTLMLDSLKTFLIIMRNLLRLRDGTGQVRYDAVIDEFERQVAGSFPTMRELLQVRQGQRPTPRAPDETFAAYIGEVEHLIDLIDRSVLTAPMEPH